MHLSFFFHPRNEPEPRREGERRERERERAQKGNARLVKLGSLTEQKKRLNGQKPASQVLKNQRLETAIRNQMEPIKIALRRFPER